MEHICKYDISKEAIFKWIHRYPRPYLEKEFVVTVEYMQTWKRKPPRLFVELLESFAGEPRIAACKLKSSDVRFHGLH